MEIGLDRNNKELEVLKDIVGRQFGEAVEHLGLSQCDPSHRRELSCDCWDLLQLFAFSC